MQDIASISMCVCMCMCVFRFLCHILRSSIRAHLPADISTFGLSYSYSHNPIFYYRFIRVYREDDIEGDDMQSYLRASLKLQV